MEAARRLLLHPAPSYSIILHPTPSYSIPLHPTPTTPTRSYSYPNLSKCRPVTSLFTLPCLAAVSLARSCFTLWCCFAAAVGARASRLIVLGLWHAETTYREQRRTTQNMERSLAGRSRFVAENVRGLQQFVANSIQIFMFWPAPMRPTNIHQPYHTIPYHTLP